jgi:hypothetical protein
MPNRRGLTLCLASATLMTGALTAAPALAAPRTHAAPSVVDRHLVCADTLSVRYSPGGDAFGTLRFGETFDVESKDSSGSWAYGAAYGHVNAHGWVIAAYLC